MVELREGPSPPPPPPPPLPVHIFNDIDPVISEPLPLSTEVTELISRTHLAQQDKDHIIITCVHNIRPVLQRGRPMCGLVGLTMANELMYGNISSSTEPLTLLLHSQQNGYSRQGEVLSSQHLLSIAKQALGCTGSIVHTTMINSLDIMDWFIARNAILIPYDCDKDHTPYIASGHSAHWCILVGVAFSLPHDPVPHVISGKYHLHPQTRELFQDIRVREEIGRKSGEDFYVFVRHGKTRHLCLWTLDKLLASASNLDELGPHRDHQEYVLPEGNLRECLSSKIVVLKRSDLVYGSDTGKRQKVFS